MAPTPQWSAILMFLLLRLGAGIEVNLSSQDSIKSVASTFIYDMMANYSGNYSGGTPGILPYPPYHWWESGAMWTFMLSYWHQTNDTTYNDIIEEALLWQTGINWDYMPANQTNGMGNDDQGIWGMTAMTAAEMNFPDPPPSGPQWLGLAQAVFNQLASRWEPDVCGGGLRWQVYFWNFAWPYKNAISNGCLFNLGARLARYTGNDTYAQWAEKTWDWITEIKMIQLQPYQPIKGHFTGTGGGGYVVWDGAATTINCSVINGIPYSYNAGIWLLGAATMYNYTNGSEIWANRTNLLLNATINTYFPSSIATEVYCEYNLTSCDTDELSFKAYLVHGMAAATRLAPFITDKVMPLMATSAKAAAAQCCGGPNGRMCGLSWINGSNWDGTIGAGQQMSALAVMMANLVQTAKAPVTGATGGTSMGDPGAGVSRVDPGTPPPSFLVTGKGDTAGASILTAIVLGSFFCGALWISSDLMEGQTVQKPLRDYVLGLIISYLFIE